MTLGWRGATTRLPNVTFVEEQPAAPVVHTVAAAAPALRMDPWTKPDPVDLCLELWKNWMVGDSDRDLGAKTMRGMCGEGDAHGVDLYEAQQANDIRIAQATNAAIDSMPRLHVWAIYRACSLASVWRFPNASLVEWPPRRARNWQRSFGRIFARRCCFSSISREAPRKRHVINPY
ncbi:hypothetical protein SAMN05428959_1011141 [Duganella sp. CF517]|uniref:hypothetical protein n=1 Tax=Duganella sp. CF517 TaxID=1881038 RepID=UPI0008C194D9|nr:hypothetical protein [Duganella sp. CF517]SEN31541.1 hypothetical protein SAMN05428959_1011141 [Duganella sp. CF517]